MDIAELDTDREFKQISQLDHVKIRPNMYIGSVSLQKNMIYIIKNKKFVLTSVEFSPGLIKIFDEILVNAIDHFTNYPTQVTSIDINFNIETGEFYIINDGPGISIVKVKNLKGENIYKPQAIFSEFLGGDNLGDNTEKIVGGMNGLGSKCFSNDTLLPLYSGILKRADDITMSDILIGDDGKERNILQIIKGTGAMYEITQARGESYKVNDKHILTIYMREHKIIFWSNNGWAMLYWDLLTKKIKTKKIKAIDNFINCDECPQRMNTGFTRHYKKMHPGIRVPVPVRIHPYNIPDMKNKEILDTYNKMQMFADTIITDNIIDISIKDYLALPLTQQNKLTGLHGNCVDWSYKETHLDAYTLGMWLGDDTSNNYTGKTNKEPMNYFIEWDELNDVTIKKSLEKYNLINNKHVPIEYIVNDQETRLKLLAGFIDGDVTVLNGVTHISINKSWKYKKLIHDVMFLARSLGFGCSMKSSIIKYKLKNGDEKREITTYYLKISGNVSDIPTLLPTRKGADSKRPSDNKSMGRIKINKIEDSDYVGFTVDGNHRLLVNDFTVTHNCTNAFSELFQVETFDATRNLLYTQIFRDRLTIVEEPEIIDFEDDITNSSFTKITFIPDYKALGYVEYTEEIGMTILQILESRAHQTAVFVGNSCLISINLGVLKLESDKGTEFEQYIKMFLTNESEMYSTVLVNKDNKDLNMHVGLGISDGKFMHTSVINGISVYEGGTHIKYISDEIVKNLKGKVEQILAKTKSKFNANFILNNLFVVVVCSVPSPEFNSQGKEKLTTPVSKFEPYKFKEKEWKTIWELLEPHITESILGKLKDKPKTRVTRGKIFLTKGNDARFAGDKKKASQCSLFIAEGDSALGLLETGINHKKTELDRDYYGTWSIQGVCPNARKEISIIMDKNNNAVCIRNDKLRDNKRFDELVRLVGLDYEKTYDIKTPEGCEEFKSLRYGRVVVATDADTDGKGMIFGLIMNFFALFWPNLVARGYLKRFNTPIIRAYPHSTTMFVKEFYALHNYEDWIKTEFGGDDELAAKKYDIKYYKGLAGNSASEIKPMFNKFETKLNTYLHDVDAQTNLEVYFGKDTAPRKDALSTPVSLIEIAKCDNTLNIPVSQFLNTDVKEFQRDNIIRKLPHVMDGLVPSRRKTFFGARMNKKMATSAVKVVNFTGEIISKTGYTHGDASLSGTIIKMAQSFIGAKNLPLLIGVGNFGSRRMGGSDHGSPRYVSIKLNKALSSAMFPIQDDFLLRYMFEDGIRVEPEYYVPIMPMAILESMQIPATGWRVKIWARDFDIVIKNVRKMILGKITKCHKLGIWLRGNECDTRISTDGNEYLVGKYTYDEKTNIISIYELPLSVYNNRYIKNIAFNKDGTLIKELKNVQDYSNYDESTNIDQVDIQFELAAGGIDIIREKYNAALKAGKSIMSESKIVDVVDVVDVDDVDDIIEETMEEYVADPLFDAIEEFFKLRLRVDSDINMIDQKNEVRELNYYGSVVNTWFLERKNLYKERIERYIVLSKLMIKFLENIIRFAEERDNLKITNKTIEQKFNEILEKNKYDKFNRALLMNPKYCKVSELENSIINGDSASYDYIISLTYKSLLKESCVKRVEELEVEKIKLNELLADCETDKTFTGQKTWIAELLTLEKIVKNGIIYGWDSQKILPKFE